MIGMMGWKLDGTNLQKAIYNTLRPTARIFWVDLAKLRSAKRLPQDINATAFWDTSLHNLLTVKGVVATSAVKTFLNSWVTSRRLHRQTRLKCIFGCTGEPDCAALLFRVCSSSGVYRRGQAQ